jgi:hypothetical protein
MSSGRDFLIPRTKVIGTFPAMTIMMDMDFTIGNAESDTLRISGFPSGLNQKNQRGVAILKPFSTKIYKD